MRMKNRSTRLTALAEGENIRGLREYFIEPLSRPTNGTPSPKYRRRRHSIAYNTAFQDILFRAEEHGMEWVMFRCPTTSNRRRFVNACIRHQPPSMCLITIGLQQRVSVHPR